MGKTALIAGASGLVGQHLLHLLLHSEVYDHIIALVRSPLNKQHPKLIEHIVNFDKLEEHSALFAVDDVFCCLGTTIKKAGSQEVMYQIDVDYPYSIAKLSQQQGAQQFLVVSAMGANPNSSIFYSRMKGELEQKLATLGYPSLSILRPALLLGERNEVRVGERIGAIVAKGTAWLMAGPLKKYKAIEGRQVARAMLKISRVEKNGVYIYSNEQLHQLAK
ncbi:oxidoreductase [Paenibacillus turicensis]|uniref:oxidoreductase n=1 Tax=Paenibacillus turicensis TaxID=160487 RepID=UPI003D2A15AD